MKRSATAILTLAALACGGDEARPSLDTATVAVTSLRAVVLHEKIEATGELIARQHAKIAGEVEGRITQVVVREGSQVAAGTVIIEIDPKRRELEVTNMLARVTEARAVMREQRRETERRRDLFSKGVAAQAQLDQAETSLALARSRLEGARARLGVAERELADASVKAPFDGRVARRFVSEGEFVKVGAELFELVSYDPLEVEFNLAEIDSGRVRLGQSVEVRVAPYPEQVFSATVTYISPTIDATTRTLRVKGSISNADGRLRPGLFARANLGIAQREGVLMAPEEAVVQRAEGPVVFRMVDADRVERRSVKLGAMRPGEVEIVDGLGRDDTIVFRGQSSLADGAVVQVREADGSDPTPPVASQLEPTPDIP